MHLPGEDHLLTMDVWMGRQSCGDQRFRVRINRVGKQLPSGGLLHDFPQVHYGDLEADRVLLEQIKAGGYASWRDYPLHKIVIVYTYLHVSLAKKRAVKFLLPCPIPDISKSRTAIPRE